MTQKRNKRGQECLLPWCTPRAAALCFQHRGAEAALLVLPAEREPGQPGRDLVRFPKACLEV